MKIAFTLSIYRYGRGSAPHYQQNCDCFKAIAFLSIKIGGERLHAITRKFTPKRKSDMPLMRLSKVINFHMT